MPASTPIYLSPQAKQPHATVLLTSHDPAFRLRLRTVLEGLRWRVLEAASGAEAMLLLNEQAFGAMVLDSWLPDLEITEFILQSRQRFPDTDVLMRDSLELATVKNPRRQELLFALRSCDETEQRTSSPEALMPYLVLPSPVDDREESDMEPVVESLAVAAPDTLPKSGPICVPGLTVSDRPRDLSAKLPEIVGSSPAIIKLCREIRLVAPRRTNVLIQGPTGSGKELIAGAVHRLSPRSSNPFIVVNCAAIPEALFEAELFGHTKGAFTGAVQARIGRLEAANGGTLFLDEIGEMPLMLQAKLLRFLEAGELQRIGENKPVKVDVRVIAATHQPLEKHAEEGKFRSDLYFRLAVFPLVAPSLTERLEDLPELATHFLRRLAVDQPSKTLNASGMTKLMAHRWPGGVRELEHVIERGYILAEDRAELTAAEIRFGSGG